MGKDNIKEITKSIRMNAETSELYESVMRSFTQEKDKQGDTLRRILETAQLNQVKALHPASSEKLSGIEASLDGIMKQVMGIIAAQDEELRRLNDAAVVAQEEREKAIVEAQNAKDILSESIKTQVELKDKIADLEKANSILERQLEHLKDADPGKVHSLEIELASAKASIAEKEKIIEILQRLIPNSDIDRESNEDNDDVGIKPIHNNIG